MTVPNWLQRRPVSHRRLNYRGLPSHSNNVTLAKMVMVFVTLTLAYYYTQSEDLLEKYSVPTGHRGMAVVDAPQYQVNRIASVEKTLPKKPVEPQVQEHEYLFKKEPEVVKPKQSIPRTSKEDAESSTIQQKKPKEINQKERIEKDIPELREKESENNKKKKKKKKNTTVSKTAAEIEDKRQRLLERKKRKLDNGMPITSSMIKEQFRLIEEKKLQQEGKQQTLGKPQKPKETAMGGRGWKREASPITGSMIAEQMRMIKEKKNKNNDEEPRYLKEKNNQQITGSMIAEQFRIIDEKKKKSAAAGNNTTTASLQQEDAWFGNQYDKDESNGKTSRVESKGKTTHVEEQLHTIQENQKKKRKKAKGVALFEEGEDASNLVEEQLRIIEDKKKKEKAKENLKAMDEKEEEEVSEDEPEEQNVDEEAVSEGEPIDATGAVEEQLRIIENEKKKSKSENTENAFVEEEEPSEGEPMDATAAVEEQMRIIEDRKSNRVIEDKRDNNDQPAEQASVEDEGDDENEQASVEDEEDDENEQTSVEDKEDDENEQASVEHKEDDENEKASVEDKEDDENEQASVEDKEDKMDKVDATYLVEEQLRIIENKKKDEQSKDNGNRNRKLGDTGGLDQKSIMKEQLRILNKKNKKKGMGDRISETSFAAELEDQLRAVKKLESKTEAGNSAIMLKTVKQGNPSKQVKQPTKTKNQGNTANASSKKELRSTSAAASKTAETEIGANISYVHYTGCCGLGHRLARMSNAYHAAQRMNFALKGTWPSCKKANVYEHLFEDEDWLAPANNYMRSNQIVSVNNEVPGYTTVTRASSKGESCDTCDPRKIDSDYEFYNQLLLRFRKRDQVEKFLIQHRFAQHTVIGMHTRAGNGEGGDFENKGRGISNTTQFVEKVRNHVLTLVDTNRGAWKKPPLLFLATDTAVMVDMFREAMANDKIPIVVLPQIRANEGAGILFGDKKNRKRRNALRAEQKNQVNQDDDEVDEREQCLMGWDQAFMDMMLLSTSDVVVATRRSSFVQTIPLSIVMGRKDRRVAKPYCEVSQDSKLEMTCHESYMDWCCCKDCVAREERERSNQGKKRKTSEYVKQFRSDLWDKPVMELYEKKMKPKQEEEE